MDPVGSRNKVCMHVKASCKYKTMLFIIYSSFYFFADNFFYGSSFFFFFPLGFFTFFPPYFQTISLENLRFLKMYESSLASARLAFSRGLQPAIVTTTECLENQGRTSYLSERLFNKVLCNSNIYGRKLYNFNFVISSQIPSLGVFPVVDFLLLSNCFTKYFFHGEVDLRDIILAVWRYV